MIDLAEWRYELGVIEGFAEARVKLFHKILPCLSEEEVIRLYGPGSDKGLSQEHITTLINIVKTKGLEEGIKEYTDYLTTDMDEEASQSLQKCLRAYRVDCTAARLKDHQSPGWVLDYLCSLYEISVRESTDIIEDALTCIREEYEEAKLKRL